MFLTPKRPVWQPCFNEAFLVIFLDAEFTEKCRGLRSIGHEWITKCVWASAKGPGAAPTNLIDFQDGILPKAFYPRGDGLRLDLKAESMDPIALAYASHNAEHPLNQMFLLRLFSAWAQIAASSVRS